MGAEFDYYEHNNNPTHEELHERWDEAVEEARYENGNGGYTGSFAEKDGLTIKTTVHADYDSAMEELQNNPKWGNAWAVPYNAKVIIPKQNLSKKKESLDKVLKELEQLKTDGIIAIRNTKSKTIGCKTCGSSINRKCVNSFNCNVCNARDAFMTPTLAKRIESKHIKTAKIRKDISTLSSDTKQTTGINYVVGGICSS